MRRTNRAAAGQSTRRQSLVRRRRLPAAARCSAEPPPVPSLLLQYAEELIANARAIATPGKGILAADESTGTIGKRVRVRQLPAAGQPPEPPLQAAARCAAGSEPRCLALPVGCRCSICQRRPPAVVRQTFCILPAALHPRQLASIGCPNEESYRRELREMLFTSPGIENYISGVVSGGVGVLGQARLAGARLRVAAPALLRRLPTRGAPAHPKTLLPSARMGTRDLAASLRSPLCQAWLLKTGPRVAPLGALTSPGCSPISHQHILFGGTPVPEKQKRREARLLLSRSACPPCLFSSTDPV